MPRWIRNAVGLGLMAAFVLVTGVAPARAGGGFCHGAPVTDTSTDRVVIADFCFTPTIVRVGLGDAVTWLNKDGTLHLVAGANGSWVGDELHLGDRTTVRFVKAGIYPYLCSLHPGMVGAVVVGDGEAAGTAGAAIPATLGTAEPSATAGQPSLAVASGGRHGVRAGSSLPWKISTFAASALFVALLAFVLGRRRIAHGNGGEGRTRNLQGSLS